MSNAQRCWGLVVAVALGVAVAMPQAHAFNPQPDPPAKQKMNSTNGQKSFKSDKASARTNGAMSSGPCKPGEKCGAIDSYKGTKKQP